MLESLAGFPTSRLQHGPAAAGAASHYQPVSHRACQRPRVALCCWLPSPVVSSVGAGGREGKDGSLWEEPAGSMQRPLRLPGFPEGCSEEPGGDVRASPAPLSQALGMEPLGSRGRKQTLHVFACPAAESSLLRSDLEVESYEEATGLFHKNKQFQFARL